MPAARFCRLAPLLPAYQGAVAATLNHRDRDRKQPAAAPSPIVPVPDVPAPQRALPAAEQPVRPIEIQMGDHAELFSFGVAGG
jgi:hypothetical protein